MPFVDKTAQALFALHGKGFLKDRDFKESITRFIRNATETDRWHLTTHYRSREAANLIRAFAPKTEAAYQGFCGRTLYHEHIVPDSYVYKVIVSEPNVTLEFLQKTLRKFGCRATITRGENASYLSRDKLTTGMPQCFYDKDHEFYDDPLARYKVTGLFDQMEKRTTDSWWPLESTST